MLSLISRMAGNPIYYTQSPPSLCLLYAIEVRRHTPWPLVRCHGCWFTHSQFHSRRYSLRITLKYTTLVRMRIGPREPAWHDNGAEVTNGLRQRIGLYLEVMWHVGAELALSHVLGVVVLIVGDVEGVLVLLLVLVVLRSYHDKKYNNTNN